jgi:hypothetical protein
VARARVRGVSHVRDCARTHAIEFCLASGNQPARDLGHHDVHLGQRADPDDPEGNQRLFRLLFFRENPEGLNPYRFTLYIRDDMLPYYNDIRYGE